MEILNKGQLVQAYVDSAGEVQALINHLSTAERRKEALTKAIQGDKRLIEAIIAGGITTHSGKVVVINDDGLCIGDVESGYSINDELTAEQMELINE